MQGWIAFKQFVESNVLSQSDHPIKGLSFWRDKLFSNILSYLLPVSLLALIPGVIMSIKDGVPLLAIYDTLAVICFLFIACYPNLSLILRKTLLVICLYVLSLILLVYLGSFGPGLLYLLALTVFITLIFPVRIALLSISINAVLCLLFALLIHYQMLDSPLTQVYSLGSWIAVCSNLIFLSVVIVACLHLLFNGLEATIIKEANLQVQLRNESKKLEKMLAEMETKNAELEQFAYIASHDLQEPLRTISGIVSLFEKQYEGKLDEEAATYLNFLAQSSTRMRALITGLLDYSKIGKDRELAVVDANLILQEIITDLDLTIRESKAVIYADKLPLLQAYPLEFRQLLQNLLSNALKFRKPTLAPEIEIRAKEEDTHWTFSVKDKGIGMDEKYAEKIFVIFQRLHPKSQYEGTGIGLAQCKKIAELHRGKIWVNSQVDKGSIFHVTIAKKEV